MRKHLLSSIILCSVLIFGGVFMNIKAEPQNHNPSETTISFIKPKIEEFFSNDFIVSNLDISFAKDNVYISGIIDKSSAKKFLESQKMLNFKTNLALMTLPEKFSAKICLSIVGEFPNIKIVSNNIEIENYSFNTNFTIYES